MPASPAVRPDPLVTAVRTAVGTSLWLLAGADAAVARAGGPATRLRTALRVPLARRAVDDL